MKIIVEFSDSYYAAFVERDGELINTPIFSGELLAMLKKEIGVEVLTRMDIMPPDQALALMKAETATTADTQEEAR